MSQKYFSMPSFSRGKQEQEQDQDQSDRAVPEEPILKEGDEEFLEQQISEQKAAPPPEPDVETTKITEDGAEEPASPQEQLKAVGGGDQVVIPAAEEGAEDGETSPEMERSYDDIMKEKAAERVKARKLKRKNTLELPSQEEAEAATKGFNARSARDAENQQNRGQQSWIGLLSTIASAAIRPSSKQSNTSEKGEAEDGAQQRSWKDYASSYVPSIPTSWRIGKKGEEPAPPSPVLNEDGTVDEEKTREKQEREVTVLLDKLSLSQINNRVFSFSGETQKIYERFAQVLKDTINGVPTAYDDMDKLFREAGPKLEEQFKSMPPFVQTLVKSLPAKFGSSLGPEILAVASEKPQVGELDIGGRPTTADSGINIPSTEETTTSKEKEKKKRRIPGLKSLLSKEGAVASMLRNVVNFLQTRFPFLASTTNVAMSLAVFILMFVFWYCHKRGKEVRLAKAAQGASVVEEDSGAEDTVEEGEEDYDYDDDKIGEGKFEEMQNYQKMKDDIDSKADSLSRPIEADDVPEKRPPLPERKGPTEVSFTHEPRKSAEET